MKFPWLRKKRNVDPQAVEELREAIGSYATKRWRLRAVTVLLSVVALLAGILFFYSDNLRQRLEAPDHAIKTHEAQQRIIFGRYYGALRSRHPDQMIIPPMDQWAPQQPKE